MNITDSASNDSMEEIRTDAPRRPTSSNGVEKDAYVAMSRPAYRQSYPYKVPLNSWDKASFGRRRPQRFWLSPSPSPSPPLIPSNICYYDPTLQPQIPSPYFWDNSSSSIYTQTLPFPSTTLAISAVTCLRHMITKQIEYYFSDDNLAKDAYLKMIMDDEGWVPITLIADFKRVRELSKDTQFVKDSLIYSTTLEVQGEKVRRRGCWKKWVISEAVRSELKRLYRIDNNQI